MLCIHGFARVDLILRASYIVLKQQSRIYRVHGCRTTPNCMKVSELVYVPQYTVGCFRTRKALLDGILFFRERYIIVTWLAQERKKHRPMRTSRGLFATPIRCGGCVNYSAFKCEQKSSVVSTGR